MNIRCAIDSIIARLQQGWIEGRVIVRHFAETENEHHRAFVEPRVQVLYVKSTFSDPIDTGIGGHDETMQLLVVVQSRQMYEQETGVLDLVSRVKMLLLGFRPEGCRKMRLKDCQIQPDPDGFPGYWTYQLSFDVDTTVVEHVEEERVPLIQQINGLGDLPVPEGGTITVSEFIAPDPNNPAP